MPVAPENHPQNLAVIDRNANQLELAQTSDPLIHPDTGLAITTTGYHWYGQEPLALAQTQDPLIHPDTGLAITTTGYHWYGQEPLALS